MTQRTPQGIPPGKLEEVGERHWGDPGAAFPFLSYGPRMRGRFYHMALITPFRDEGTAAGLLEVASAHYEDALEALEIVKLYLKEGSDLSSAEIARAAADLRKATQTLFDERKRLEDQRRKEAGVVHDFGLDFDAARNEIGRRLDRLRAARGAEGVSG